MQVRSIAPEDHDEWLRMRKALWPATPESTLRAEMADIVADTERQAVFIVERTQAELEAGSAHTRGADAWTADFDDTVPEPVFLGGFVELSIHPHAIGCDSRHVGYLEAWYVDEDLRRTGVGGLLVAAGEAWARSRGCREIASDALLGNAIGITAHLACGYTETERLVHFKKPL